MTERPNLGQILMGLGRIDESDVDRALEHQRKTGGYFGEALLALGLVSKEELEWGLASQFDLPYIFPDADSIDPDAAALVTPEWALAHLTMPILRTADALTVVVDSPIRTQAVEELSARTDRRIELALASGERIRELIQQVYTRVHAGDVARRPAPVTLGAGLGMALEAAATRFGISVRQHRAWFWYHDAGTARRHRLEGNWEADLDRAVSPPPSSQLSGDRARYRGSLNREGIVTPVEVEFLSGPGGREYLFRPMEERSLLHDRFPPPPPALLGEIRLLARSGSARFAVVAPDDIGPDILCHLPALLLDPSWRSVHLGSATAPPRDDVLQVRLPSEDQGRAEVLEGLRDFGFDVVTVDLSETGVGLTDAVADVAGVVFARWPDGADRRLAHEAGIRWELEIRPLGAASLEWSLAPLRA